MNTAPAGSPQQDPGLAAYRTRLSWRRTTLALTVVAVLAVRLALGRGAVGALVAATALAGWVAVLALTSPMVRGGTLRARPAVAPLSALATAGYAAAGVILMLTNP